MYNRLERIKELHKRLDMVIIENLSYEKVIEKYDTKSNFFYCDPPYMQGYTYENSKQFSHEALRDILKSIKGRFILSYDDNPDVLKLYKGYDIKHVTRTKGINRKEGKSEFNEVIIATSHWRMPGSPLPNSLGRGVVVNSIISWVGGKRLLRKKILPLIPKHDIYCEVFGGAAWILFGKSPNKEDWQMSKKSRYTEVYNDINGDLVNFWRYIKQHPEAFVTELNQYLVSREMFDSFTQHEPRTELERAIRFYFQLSCSYGSRSKNFCIMQGYKYMPLRQLEKVKAASERLRHVIIEKQPWEKIVARFDTPNTFFYLDPPYYTKKHLYDREDADALTKHVELASALKNIKGKFLLSYNNDPYIRTLYRDFTIDEVEAQYTVSGSFQTETEL